MVANPVCIKRKDDNCFYIFLNGLPTVASTCRLLRMAYKHYDCLTNALLIPSDLNANIAFSAVGCRFGSQNGVFVILTCHDKFLVQR